MTSKASPVRVTGPLAAQADGFRVELAGRGYTPLSAAIHYALLVIAIQCGLRVSELTGLTCADIFLGTGAHVLCHGKGRKQRATPLTTGTVAVLRAWLSERQGQPTDPLFPASRGGSLSRDAVEKLVAKHTAEARRTCPSLRDKPVSPHTLRHSSAMQLLHAGIDTTVIALWLGHEQIDTTNIYLHADLALKERAIARITPPGTTPGRYRAPDTLLAFLDRL